MQYQIRNPLIGIGLGGVPIFELATGWDANRAAERCRFNA